MRTPVGSRCRRAPCPTQRLGRSASARPPSRAPAQPPRARCWLPRGATHRASRPRALPTHWSPPSSVRSTDAARTALCARQRTIDLDVRLRPTTRCTTPAEAALAVIKRDGDTESPVAPKGRAAACPAVEVLDVDRPTSSSRTRGPSTSSGGSTSPSSAPTASVLVDTGDAPTSGVPPGPAVQILDGGALRTSFRTARTVSATSSAAPPDSGTPQLAAAMSRRSLRPPRTWRGPPEYPSRGSIEVGLPEVGAEHLVLDVAGCDAALDQGGAHGVHERHRPAEVVGGVGG
jgi:hypothetical protein